MSEISNDSECVFSFWVGMPFATQVRILEISSACPTITTIAVFRDRKWPSPAEGTSCPGLIYGSLFSSNSTIFELIFPAVLGKLIEFDPVGSGRWHFLGRVNASMFGSGEKKTAWVFSR